jgi:hypothetical protein
MYVNIYKNIFLFILMENKLFECSVCNKEYNSYHSMWRHKKITHSNNKTEDIDEDTANNVCKYCGKILSDRKARWRHETKTCKKNPEFKKENNTANNSNTYNISQSKNVSVIQNQTNNNIVNNNITFQFNSLGKEDVMQLTEEQREQVIKDGLNSLTTLVKYLNFNKDLPENHTYCNTNLNNKYISALNIDTKEIEKHRKIDFFDKVLISILAHLKKLNENISDVIKQDDFEKKIEQIEKYVYFQSDYKKVYVEEINAISYNKRKDVQNTWNKILIGNQINE